MQKAIRRNTDVVVTCAFRHSPSGSRADHIVADSFFSCQLRCLSSPTQGARRKAVEERVTSVLCLIGQGLLAVYRNLGTARTGFSGDHGPPP